MSVLSFPKPGNDPGYPQLTDFDAWFLKRRIAGFNDPIVSAPVSAWIPEFLQRLDIRKQAGLELLYSIVGTEGQRRIEWQNPKSPEPIPFQSDQPSPSLGVKIRANDLKRLPVPKYILADFPIYENGINGLVGASGTGKSFVALHIAAALACMLSQGRSVIYLAFEGLHGYSARWEAWKAHFHQDTNNLIFYGDPVNFMIASELAAFIEQIRPDHPALVIVDTVARSMTGADENATRDMGIFVAAVEQVRRDLQCTVLLVHHTNKQGGMRGNSSLYNACDSVLFLKRVGSQIELHNDWESNGKNKHRPEEPTRYLKLLPKTVQVGEQTFESAVLVDSDVIIQDEFTLKPSDLKILQAVNGFENGLPAKAIIESTGIPKTNIYRWLKPLIEYGYLTQTQANFYQITELGKEALGTD